MIEPALYLGFVVAAAVLILIPGPNVALIVANSLSRGTRGGLLTVAGTSSAVVVQLGLTALGLIPPGIRAERSFSSAGWYRVLFRARPPHQPRAQYHPANALEESTRSPGGITTALTMLAVWFEWLRWIGVAYLLFLGLRQWFAPAIDLTRVTAEPRRAGSIWGRGFLVGLTNPKTLLFYGAFFPQFLDPHRPLGPQVGVLCVTFLIVATTLDSGWAIAAARTRWLLAARPRLRNRLSGSCLIAAGAGLALAHRR